MRPRNLSNRHASLWHLPSSCSTLCFLHALACKVVIESAIALQSINLQLATSIINTLNNEIQTLKSLHAIQNDHGHLFALVGLLVSSFALTKRVVSLLVLSREPLGDRSFIILFSA